MKLLIKCNPYEKTIDYYWFEDSEGKYVDLSEHSGYCPELTNAKYTKNVTIQSRADEIVRIIDNLDPADFGIDVHFIGTQDDFDDLKRVVELFYANKNIHCIKEPTFFHDAEYSLAQIKEHFSRIEDIFTDYKEDEILELLISYEETIKPELAVCVMGLYSSGKSAFINSLVGCELLPSASDPTTAKVCKIQCRDTYSISLWVNGQEYCICFDEDFPAVSGDDSTIVGMLQEHAGDGEDSIAKMYHLLKFLNTNHPFGETFMDGSLVTITLPYIKTMLPTEKFDFVIYDTPGSNSASNAEHFAVLNEALTVQTNALPIILTTPDTMDSMDNDALLGLIHGYENKLDTTNGLIVVNKADDKGPRSLAQKRDKIDGLKLTKWKSTRIFFVSSILGLASKKDNPHDESCWFDLDSFEIYEKNSSLYESGERKLYTFNIIDKSRVFEYHLTEKDGVNALLLYNSGLASIELELANYAQRYAQYIKCREAIKYLREATSRCEKNVHAIEEKQVEELSTATAQFEAKKKQVLDAMAEQHTAVVEKADELFKLEMTELYEKFKKEHQISTTFGSRSSSFIYTAFQEQWTLIKTAAAEHRIDEKQTLQQMQAYVTDQFNKILRAFSDATNCEIDAFWETRTGVFKKILRSIIMNSPKLNPEQKEILDAAVLSMNNMTSDRVEFDLREHKGIKMGIIPFIPLGKESYNNSGCCRNFLLEFEKQVSERVDYVKTRNHEAFDAWCGRVIEIIGEKISTFNEELHEAEERIAVLQEEIDLKNRHIELLHETTEYIENLLNEQTPKDESAS